MLGKRYIYIVVPKVVILMFIFASSLFGKEILPVVNVGVVVDGPWEQNDGILDMFKMEIIDLTEGEFDIRFPEEKHVTADYTRFEISRAIDYLLNDPQVDLIITMGALASDEACIRGDLPKPVIAPFVVDHFTQDTPIVNGTSGVKNLNYLTFGPRKYRDLDAFREIVHFDKVYLLASKYFIDNVPLRSSSEYPESYKNAFDFELETIAVKTTAEDALNQLPDDAEAVYITALIGFSPSEKEKLTQGLINRKIASFSMFGKSEVRLGFLAGLATEPMFGRRARRVALNFQRILLGENAGDIPVSFSDDERLTINMSTARAIGIYPDWSVLTEAELIQEERTEAKRLLTLSGAVKEALRANLDLFTSEQNLDAGKQDVKNAWSNLLPHLELSALGTIIDKDRADASFGQQAERTLTGSASISQVIYSEPAWANISIQRHLQNSRKYEHEQLKLDIAFETATAYLNILKANTYERIQKENLRQSRTNLELSRIREAIGFSGPAEVYRWESQIALNRKTVIEASAQRNLAEMQLNRILHHPVEENFFTADVSLQEPDLLIANERLFDYAANPWSFKILRAFVVKEGLERSPELKAIDEAISVQKRSVNSSKHSFWSPTIALKAELSEVLVERGAGSNSPSLPGTKTADDTDWSIGLNASLPLFSGGSKFNNYNKSRKELKTIESIRQSTVEKIEQRIRSAMHRAGASNAGIKQLNSAANAAMKNLELVRDAYSRGTVSIIELIDAQNASLTAEEGAANAVYDFLLDYTEVQRASGRFDYFLSAEEREQWFEKLDKYFEEHDADLP